MALVAVLPGAGPAASTAAAGDAGQLSTTVRRLEGDARNLTVVGHTDLGGKGLNGEVAVVGTTAIVGAGYVPMNIMEQATNKTAALNIAPPCVTVPVKVVDLSDPSQPRVASTIPVPDGQAGRYVDALHMSTPAFTGDLPAVAFSSCRYHRPSYFERGVSLPGTFAHRGVAFYDVTDPYDARLLGRYLADQEDFDPSAPPCSAPPAGNESNCAKDQFSVQLKRIRDGRVLALSTTAQGSARNATAGDMRIVDVSDPRKPTQLGTWPPPGEVPLQTSNNGCYARGGARHARFTPDGTKILLPYLDTGLYVFDVNDLSRPRVVGQWIYPQSWDVEGQGAYVSTAEVDGKDYALLADEDWWWATNAFRVDSPPEIAGVKVGCADLAVTMDTRFVAQASRQPGGQATAELAYVGRGCANRISNTGQPVLADPYLTNPAGKIAFIDTNAALQPNLPTTFCSGGSRIRRAQDVGAKGLIVARTAALPDSTAGFPALGSPVEPTDEVGALTGYFTIPSFNPKIDATVAIRNVLCPAVVAGACSGGRPVTGSLVDLPGAWGGLRVIDQTNPAALFQVAEYKTANSQIFPPPDHRGVYSINHTVVEEQRAYAAWNTDGLRVLDLRSGGTPIEIASFVPPDRPDPTGTVPAKAYVGGVALMGGHVVVSDMNSGLWVVTKPGPAGGRGHWLAAADGGVFAFGDAPFLGSMGQARLNAPIVGMASTPTGKGYWLVARDGGVFAFGDAPYRGSMGRTRLNAPVVGMASTDTGRGYWLTAADGGVFAFGDAAFKGSAAGVARRPVVGIAPTPTGAGYRLASADGGVFAYGDAAFRGSAASLGLRSPVVGVASSGSGRGYWLASADGGVFAFGDAPFRGSAAGSRLSRPITAVASGSGNGYWLSGADGGVFALGAPFLGNLVANRLASPITGAAAVPR